MSTTKRPRILICNDDGIHAPGIRHLWQALRGVGDLMIAAPADQQSGKGLSITLHTPLRAIPVDWSDCTEAYRVTGTPADCVKLALAHIWDSAPDLVVSGINAGSNAGRNVLYSGTVGCTIEAVLRGIPAIAFSCIGSGPHGLHEMDYAATEAAVRRVTEYVLEHPLGTGNLLNVNFPAGFKGLRWARQGLQYWLEQLEERKDPAGQTYCWLGGRLPNWKEQADSDIALLEQGYATAVPIHVSELTHEKLYQERREQFEGFVESEVKSCLRD